MSLTPEQVEIVRSTAPVLAQYGSSITTLFYQTLLEENPSMHNVFNQTNQVNNHQAKALAGSLYAYASHVDDLGALSPAVEKICQKHASLYIQPDQYGAVGEGLLRAMAKVLGDACTPVILDAWTAAYWQLANIMIAREQRLYSSCDGWTEWRNFTIAKKVEESEEITSFYLEPVDRQPLPTFLPGQYTSVLVDVPSFGYTQSRQYSLSDAPNEKYYRISVKKEVGEGPQVPEAQTQAGWISNILHDDKEVGDVVKLSHPAGDFFHDSNKNGQGPIVLLSAGVGITPMMSILNTLIQQGSKQPISFLHGARSSTVRAFADHLKEQDDSHDNVRTVIFIKNPVDRRDIEGVHYHKAGRLNLARLDPSKDLFLSDNKTKYYVCGPERFMAQTWRELQNMGVSEERIKMEVFGTGELVK